RGYRAAARDPRQVACLPRTAGCRTRRPRIGARLRIEPTCSFRTGWDGSVFELSSRSSLLRDHDLSREPALSPDPLGVGHIGMMLRYHAPPPGINVTVPQSFRQDRAASRRWEAR